MQLLQQDDPQSIKIYGLWCTAVQYVKIDCLWTVSSLQYVKRWKTTTLVTTVALFRVTRSWSLPRVTSPSSWLSGECDETVEQDHVYTILPRSIFIVTEPNYAKCAFLRGDSALPQLWFSFFLSFQVFSFTLLVVFRQIFNLFIYFSR